MNWKLNPKTGMMEPTISPSKEIEKAVIPMREEPNWSGLNTVRENMKILYGEYYYLAVSFQGKWRLLGVINNMDIVRKYLNGPLINFHDAWLKGLPIDEPKF